VAGKNRGSVVSATADVRIEVRLQPTGVGGPLPGLGLSPSTRSWAENLQIHISAPIFGTLLNPLLERIATQHLNNALDSAIRDAVSRGANNALAQYRQRVAAAGDARLVQCNLVFTSTAIELHVTVAF